MFSAKDLSADVHVGSAVCQTSILASRGRPVGHGAANGLHPGTGGTGCACGSGGRSLGCQGRQARVGGNFKVVSPTPWCCSGASFAWSKTEEMIQNQSWLSRGIGYP
eukprot:s1267_g46.t1